jgi:dynein light chain LC8-type
MAEAQTEDEALHNISVVYTEMTEAQQKSTLDICLNALKTQEKSDIIMYQKDVAAIVKKELDASRGGTWNVVVGQSFGSFVTHETKTMSQFFVGNLAFLIWRHG